jgi:hypothetical protein
MIVNTGKLKLLTYQYPDLEDAEWCLFTDNETITSATVWADLTEAAFSGYSRVAVGPLNTATIVSTRGSTTPVTQPVFTNGSGGSENVYGWALIDVSGSPVLIAAENFGLTTIPAGQSLALQGTITDTQE